MYKMEHVLWRGVLTVITAAAMFVLLYRYTCAEEIAYARGRLQDTAERKLSQQSWFLLSYKR